MLSTDAVSGAPREPTSPSSSPPASISRRGTTSGTRSGRGSREHRRGPRATGWSDPEAVWADALNYIRLRLGSDPATRLAVRFRRGARTGGPQVLVAADAVEIPEIGRAPSNGSQPIGSVGDILRIHAGNPSPARFGLLWLQAATAILQPQTLRLSIGWGGLHRELALREMAAVITMEPAPTSAETVFRLRVLLAGQKLLFWSPGDRAWVSLVSERRP